MKSPHQYSRTVRIMHAWPADNRRAGKHLIKSHRVICEEVLPEQGFTTS